MFIILPLGKGNARVVIQPARWAAGEKVLKIARNSLKQFAVHSVRRDAALDPIRETVVIRSVQVDAPAHCPLNV